MGFLSPKPPKTPKPPTPATTPIFARDNSAQSNDPLAGLSSLISTSASGLKRKANTQRTSLIGG